MLSREEYVQQCLSTHLFWVRIMKEHAIFIEATMPPPGKQLALRADSYKQQYDRYLSTAILLSNGLVTAEVLQSGQLYTKYTEEAEQQAQKFTGIYINRELTRITYRIEPFYSGYEVTVRKEQDVSLLTQNLLSLTNAFVQFQTELLNYRSSCGVFTMMYTADIEHVLLEAKRYQKILSALQSREEPSPQDDREFWTQNMAGHAKVIRGELDPTEAARFQQANQLADQFDALAQAELRQDTFPPDRTLITDTQAIRDFKAEMTQGLIDCGIRAIMLALYTDHLLREANHFLFLMNQS